MQTRGHLLAIVAVLGACVTTQPRSGLQQSLAAAGLTPQELRLRVRALAPTFSGQLEALADELAAATDDPAKKRTAIGYKIEAIPLMQAALFQPDPAVAILDAWSFLAQIDARARELAREEHLEAEEQQLIAVHLGALEDRLVALWSTLTGTDGSRARARVWAWAKEHPTRTLAARDSPASLFAALAGDGSGLGAVAGQLLEDSRDLSARLDLQTVWLPKIARWQGEYLLRQLVTDPPMIEVPGVHDLVANAEQLMAQAGGLPEFVARERREALGVIHEERLGMQDFAAAQRVALTNDLRAERVAAMAHANEIADAVVDRAFDRMEAMVDRLLWRLGLAVLGVVALGLLAALLVTRRRRGEEIARGAGVFAAARR